MSTDVTPLPAASPLMSLDEAKALVQQLLQSQPATCKGAVNVSVSNWSFSMSSRDLPDGGWRIAVIATQPLFNGVLGALASQATDALERRIGFVLQGLPEGCTLKPADGPEQKAHYYTLICGIPDLMSSEMLHAKPFRDPVVRSFYRNSIFNSSDLDQITSVIRSEVTGDPAFPDSNLRATPEVTPRGVAVVTGASALVALGLIALARSRR
jgi:hypothetical protein